MSLSEKEIKEKIGVDTFSKISQLKNYHLTYNQKYRLFLINENKNNNEMTTGFAAYLKPEVDGYTYTKRTEPKVGIYEHGHIFAVQLIQHILKLKTPEFKCFKNRDELSADYLKKRLAREYKDGIRNIILQTDQANEYGKNNMGQAKFEQCVSTFLKDNRSAKIQVYYQAEAIYKDLTMDLVNTPPIGTRLYAVVVGEENNSLNKFIVDPKKKPKPHIPFHVFIPNINE